jgi:hypothetical protein
MTFDLIYPAVLVFLLMLVGVVLTAIEFNSLEKKQSKDKDGPGSSGS